LLPIIENYRDYSPPVWVRASVERLIGSLALEHVNGLESIVLTNAAAVGRGKTNRVGGRKYHRSACRGFYNPGSRNQRPWIQIVVDTTVPDAPRFVMSMRIVQDFFIADALYHEVGHHLDATIGSASRGGEAAANDWCRRLTKLHVRRRYRHLISAIKLLRGVLKLSASLARRLLKEEDA